MEGGLGEVHIALEHLEQCKKVCDTAKEIHIEV